MTGKSTSRGAAARRPSYAQWSKTFLGELAATSNVTAAAKAADVSTSTVYETRRTNAEFNRQWQVALCEGYEALEMELLHRLRSGELKSAPGAKRAARAFDNATAFRLLSAHRESATRTRAIRANQDTEAIIASINAKIDKIRERKLAALPAVAAVIDGE